MCEILFISQKWKNNNDLQLWLFKKYLTWTEYARNKAFNKPVILFSF